MPLKNGYFIIISIVIVNIIIRKKQFTCSLEVNLLLLKSEENNKKSVSDTFHFPYYKDAKMPSALSEKIREKQPCKPQGQCRRRQGVLQVQNRSSLQPKRGPCRNRCLLAVHGHHAEQMSTCSSAEAWRRNSPWESLSSSSPRPELQPTERNQRWGRRAGDCCCLWGHLLEKFTPEEWVLWNRDMLEECLESCSLWEALSGSLWKGQHPLGGTHGGGAETDN